MDGFKVGAVAFLALIAIVLVRQWKPEWGLLLRVAAAVVLLSMIVQSVSYVIEEIRGFCGQALPDGALSLLFKSLGIAFLSGTGASVCRDCGESGLATWVEMAGKVEILVLSLPLIQEVLTEAGELLGMSGL